jgi:hypothetical protein
MEDAPQISERGTGQGERRQSVRYPLSGATWFRWRSTDGHWHEGSGVTCDISKAGAFIIAATIPAVSSQLRLVVTLPVTWGKGQELRLCGSGDVRHARQGAGAAGYGASVVFHPKAPAWAG